MKSQPDPDTTPEDKYAAFQSDLRRVLTFTKGDLRNLEEAYQRERAGKPRRGPKRGPRPKTSASSARASRDKD